MSHLTTPRSQLPILPVLDVLDAKRDDLSLTPGIHKVEYRTDKQKLSPDLHTSPVACTYVFRDTHVCVETHTYEINVIRSTLTMNRKSKSNPGKNKRKELPAVLGKRP